MVPFNRGLPWSMDHGFSSSYSMPSPPYDSFRSNPPTPPPFHSVRPNRSCPRPLPPNSVNSFRKITPLEEKIPGEKEQRAVAKEADSPYDQARNYVERYEAWREGKTTGWLDSWGESLSIKMPYKDWSKLSEDLDVFETDQRWPRYSYNASTSTLIIELMPSPVHESIISTFNVGFVLATATSTESIQSSTNIVTGQDFTDFEGQYDGSWKVPDLALEVKDAAGIYQPKFVLEVGLSETYEQLVQDTKLWLDGDHNVSVVALVKFTENPRYRCPVPNPDVETLNQLGIPKTLSEIRPQDFTYEREYGPVTYQGLKWMGEISEVFMEVWKRDPATGLATKDGDRTDLFGTLANLSQVKFQLSDFVAVQPQDNQTISFNWRKFPDLLKDKIQDLAVERCRKSVKRARKSQGEIGDKDYQPSQDTSPASSM